MSFAGLMLHFPMDKLTNDSILEGDINMNLNGNPVLVNGVRGKAVSFNGVDQDAEIGVHK